MSGRGARILAGIVAAVALAAFFDWRGGVRGEGKSAFGFNGLSEVKELVVVYEPGSPARVKAHLVSGLAVSDEIKDPEALARVLQISTAFAQPRARLAVTLEGNAITAYHLATGAGAR